MIFSVLLSSALLICSSSAASSNSNKHELGSSESRGYSSHPSAPPPAAYEPREPEAVYSKSNQRGYESGEDASAAQEDYAPKSQAKKTVILAIPVKLALQQAEREKATSSYESSGESYGSGGGLRAAYPTSYASYADQPGGRIEAGNNHAETWSRPTTAAVAASERASANNHRQTTGSQNNHNSHNKLQHNARFREWDIPNSNHNNNLNHFTFKTQNNYDNDETAGNGNSNNAHGSSSNNHNNNNQYDQYTAVVPNQNNQMSYNQPPPSYAASASQGYAQSSPAAYVPTRDQGERHVRTYTDKSPPPKPYQPENDVDHSPPPSYSSAQSYDYTPKQSRPSSYADEASYEVEEPAAPQPRPRKTYKRPAAYVEESAEEESYSRPSGGSSRIPSKYFSNEPESDGYPGLDGASGYHQEMSDMGKGGPPSYGGETMDEADYTSSLSSLGLQSYASPSLPQSELSYLMNKMPRGFSPVPAASSYGLDMGGGPRHGSYPYGFPARPVRRPYAPAPYGPSPYLKSPFAGSAYPSSKLYLPAASLRSYSATPFYGSASSPVPASSPFRLSSAVASGLNLGKTFGAGKGLRIGPLEFGSSGSLFPSIKIKSPVRV